jgi:hypothetical protein
MASPTKPATNPTPAAVAKAAAASKPAPDALGDLPSDPVALAEEKAGVRSPTGAGTTQKEPKPEDLPASAKITPVAEQLNPNANATVVGTPGDAITSDARGTEPADTEQSSVTGAGNAAGANTTNDGSVGS